MVTWNKSKKVAIFWDADNIPIFARGRNEMLAKEITKYPKLSGDIVVYRVYGSNFGVNSEKERIIRKLGADFIEIPKGREFSLDNRLISDCLAFHNKHPEIDNYFIVSGDGIYTNLAKVLKQLGKQVIVHGLEKRTSRVLRETVNYYFPVFI